MADRVRLGRDRHTHSSLVGASVALVLVFGGGLLLAGAMADDSPPPPPPPAQAAAATATATATATPTPTADLVPQSLRPARLSISRLGVQAPVLPIRVVDGALTPPADPQQIGWWSDGARPGDAAGTAVLTGHTVHTGGGALDDLETLELGDEIAVGDGRRKLTYVVSSIETLSTGDVARRNQQLFRQGGPARLMLVTCEDWNGVAYESSVIVYAKLRA